MTFNSWNVERAYRLQDRRQWKPLNVIIEKDAFVNVIESTIEKEIRLLLEFG